MLAQQLEKFLVSPVCQNARVQVKLPTGEFRSPDGYFDVKKIKIPSEIVYAEISHTYSPRARKEIDRLGKNWNSKCYNDATHFLPMEKSDSVIEDIIKYIKDFL